MKAAALLPPHAPPHDRAHHLAAAALLRGIGRFLDTQERATGSEARGRSEAGIQNTGTPPGAPSRDALRQLRVGQTSGTHGDEELLLRAERLAAGGIPWMPGRAGIGGGPALAPVLGAVYGHRPPGSEAEIPVSALSFAEDCFLPGPPQDDAACQPRYGDLTALLTAALQPGPLDPRGDVERLLALCQRLLSSVPDGAATAAPHDVSVFDACRVSAAFASCLGVHGSTGAPDAPRFRLASLGLGGIQSFIFRQMRPADQADTERGRAKRLRARSFYVTLLTTLAARRLLASAGLPVVNVVLDAGGRVMLLLPVTDEMELRLADGARYVREWFTSRLAGSIRVDLTLGDILSEVAFGAELFAATFRRAGDQLDESRLYPPADRFRDEGGWLDDAWCGTTPGLPVDTEGFANQLQALGGALPRAKYVELDGAGGGLLRDPLDILGYRVQLHERKPATATAWALGLDPEPSYPVLITANYVPIATPGDVTRLLGTQREDEADISTDFVDDDERPEAGETLTFSHLARLSSDDDGEPVAQAMLGALKADVDHLGLLTGYGLGTSVSLARLGALSRSLDLFFKGFLTEALRNRYPHVYTVFSGGDDLFLVGPWYDLVRLAPDLHRWFRRHAADNPRVTLSAGLVFTKPTTPVRELARSAEAALETAKETGRNRVTVGTTTLSWNRLGDALELHRLLHEAATTDDNGVRSKVTPSLLYRLQTYALMGQRAESGSTTGRAVSMADLKWRAQLAYDVRRNLPLGRPQGATPDAVMRDLHSKLMQIRADDTGVLRIAAMLTLYQLRGD